MKLTEFSEQSLWLTFHLTVPLETIVQTEPAKQLSAFAIKVMEELDFEKLPQSLVKLARMRSGPNISYLELSVILKGRLKIMTSTGK